MSVLIIAEKQGSVVILICRRGSMAEIGLDLIGGKHALVGVQHDGTGGYIWRDGGWAVGMEKGRKVDCARVCSSGCCHAGGGSGRVVAAKHVVVSLDGNVLMSLVVHIIIIISTFAAAVSSNRGAIHVSIITGIRRRRIVRADGVGPGDGEKGRGFKRFVLEMFRRRYINSRC